MAIYRDEMSHTDLFGAENTYTNTRPVSSGNVRDAYSSPFYKVPNPQRGSPSSHSDFLASFSGTSSKYYAPGKSPSSATRHRTTGQAYTTIMRREKNLAEIEKKMKDVDIGTSNFDYLYSNEAQSYSGIADMNTKSRKQYADDMIRRSDSRAQSIISDIEKRNTKTYTSGINKGKTYLDETRIAEEIADNKQLQGIYRSQDIWRKFGSMERGTISDARTALSIPKVSPAQVNTGKKAAQETAEKAMKESDKFFSKFGKYGKVALGFGATAWLVNKLSDTRGQQTNAQLYGQQQYY